MPEAFQNFNWRKAFVVMGLFGLVQYAYGEILQVITFPEGTFNYFSFWLVVFLPHYILITTSAFFFFKDERPGLAAGALLTIAHLSVLFAFLLTEDILRGLFNASYRIAVIDSVLGALPPAVIIIGLCSLYFGWRRA
jgi:hypothetical protein